MPGHGDSQHLLGSSNSIILATSVEYLASHVSFIVFLSILKHLILNLVTHPLAYLPHQVVINASNLSLDVRMVIDS